MQKLLVANRGEIAVRILQSAADFGITTVAVYSEDDAGALHVRRADEAHALAGVGPAAYLDTARVVEVARASGCDAIHPGYGLASESAEFAGRCAESGITFVGPTPETLAALGDKVAARALAERCGVRVPRGSSGPVQPADAEALLRAIAAPVFLKAVAGGGGRGLRRVDRREDLESAFARAQSEAQGAFGDGRLYVEELLPHVRHVEVQIAGDVTGAVTSLGERECSLQRRHQKIVEIAPCPSLGASLRASLVDAAMRMATALGYRGLGTFEFLVDATALADEAPGRLRDDARFWFIEANPRLQVEHTVTEAVLGVDLVRTQIELARGATLRDLALDPGHVGAPRGYAIQARICAESISADGSVRPSTGVLSALSFPSGRGVRVDTAAHVGYRANPAFDSLVVKVVAHSTSPHFADAVACVRRVLRETRIEGLRTNLGFLQSLLEQPDVSACRVHTGWIDDHLPEILATERLASTDPLAVLAHGKRAPGRSAPLPEATATEPLRPLAIELDAPTGAVALRAPMQGTLLALEVSSGEHVERGQALLVMTAMKMEHVLEAPATGTVGSLLVAPGDTVLEGQVLGWIAPTSGHGVTSEREASQLDPGHVRPDLAEVFDRHARTLDESRPDAVARRRKTKQRTARENVADLCDPGSFVEYGALTLAAQRQRRPLEDLIARTPADGLVTGVGRVNGELFGDTRTHCAVLAYDYTVLAGTQGYKNHHKKDRLFELAERQQLPVVLFAEGGGGRPGDTDAPGVAGLDCMAFHLFARLSGWVPLVGINSGRCFAGNAALLGCCDVVIATAGSNIGMGGPAMVEGGGLGVFRPEDIGPMEVQVENGVVDVPVADEAEAVAVAKRYLSYFQGALARWECADQRVLRHLVPENRLRVYDVRSVIDALADGESVLELRRAFGRGMVTALARIEGRPCGIVANDPRHLSGAIDSPGADKAARFLQLCDAFDLPVLFLCDTPGIMVGPEVEKTALVRHCSRLFTAGANLTVPSCTIVLRKSYGLGAQAMAGGSHKAPVFTASWPTGEFGGMGLEGAVKLGFRKELAAIGDPAERLRTFELMVARAYERGKALNVASHFEIDAVIDPADSRRWISAAFASSPPPPRRHQKKRPFVDTW